MYVIGDPNALLPQAATRKTGIRKPNGSLRNFTKKRE